jgi:hypothetical protein
MGCYFHSIKARFKLYRVAQNRIKPLMHAELRKVHTLKRTFGARVSRIRLPQTARAPACGFAKIVSDDFPILHAIAYVSFCLQRAIIFSSHQVALRTKTGDSRNMPIIRVTRKQIQEANKAREAALKKDADFRRHEEQLQRFEEAAKARAAALQKELTAAAADKEEQPS